MAGYSNGVDIDVWPVSKLIDATAPSPAGSSKITIPEFQRRLVWNKSKQAGLITSIRAGYPFGSILLYEDIGKGQRSGDGKRYYNLIDGLQRTQALRSYIQNQNGFFDRAELQDDFIDFVARELGRVSENAKDQIRQTIVKWVKGRKSREAQDGWRAEGITQALVRGILDYQPDTSLYKETVYELITNARFADRMSSFLDAVRSEAQAVLDAKIPVLIYTGRSSELPRVFELLNSKGTALTRYEIFAAQWINTRGRIANPEVVDAIWKKNESLEEEGFTLDISEEAQDEASRRQRDYSLFDYLFGLGQVLCAKYPLLFKPAKEDRPSSVGFNLMTACMGLHVKDMAKLPQRISGLDMTELEGCLLEATAFVNRLLKPLLSARQVGRKQAPIYHSELMIIAMIATAFQLRFGLRDLADNPNWRADRRKLKKSLIMAYLLEILHDDWRGSGDSKLYDTVRSMRYLEADPPTEKRWRQVLDDWYYQNQIDLVHKKNSKRHIRDSRPEYLLLKYIFTTRMDKARNYHVEHIVPVARLQSQMSAQDEWHINTIGNLALLPKAGEFRHNVDTYDVMLRDQLATGAITLEQRDALQSQYERQLLCPPDMLPTPLDKKSFEDFLTKRWEHLKSEFISAWRDHMPAQSAS